MQFILHINLNLIFSFYGSEAAEFDKGLWSLLPFFRHLSVFFALECDKSFFLPLRWLCQDRSSWSCLQRVQEGKISVRYPCRSQANERLWLYVWWFGGVQVQWDFRTFSMSYCCIFTKLSGNCRLSHLVGIAFYLRVKYIWIWIWIVLAVSRLLIWIPYAPPPKKRSYKVL